MNRFRPNSMFKEVKVDRETKLLNRYSLDNFYIRDKDILKRRLLGECSKELFDLYKTLSEYDIIPKYKIDKSGVMFDMSNMISLRTFLDHEKINFSLVIHELISFVSKFKSRMFRHGNLNLDNIFVKKGWTDTIVEFRIIDVNVQDKNASNNDVETIKNVLKVYYNDRNWKKLSDINRLMMIFS